MIFVHNQETGIPQLCLRKYITQQNAENIKGFKYGLKTKQKTWVYKTKERWKLKLESRLDNVGSLKADPMLAFPFHLAMDSRLSRTDRKHTKQNLTSRMICQKAIFCFLSEIREMIIFVEVYILRMSWKHLRKQ